MIEHAFLEYGSHPFVRLTNRSDLPMLAFFNPARSPVRRLFARAASGESLIRDRVVGCHKLMIMMCRVWSGVFPP